MLFPTIQIDEKKCVRCGSCVKDCLAKILTLDSGFPRFVPGGEARCFRCQHCMAVCPTGAFGWNGKEAGKSLLPGKTPDPQEVLNLLRQRRSVRQYKRENVPDEVLQALRSAMDFVPTGCNDHRLFFTCAEDVSVTDSFREDARKAVLERIRNATLPAKIAHFERLQPALEGGVDVFFRNAPHFAAIAVPSDAKDAHIDPYIAAAQFEILASAFGLGTCWGGMATDLFQSVPALLERLEIPPTHELKIIMLFGPPAVQYRRLPQPEPCEWRSLKKE